MEKKKKYYSIQEIAVYFSVSEATVRKFIISKKIKSINFGNVYRIPQSEIQRIRENGIMQKDKISQ